LVRKITKVAFIENLLAHTTIGITKIPTLSNTVKPVIPRTPIPNTGKYWYLNKKIKTIKKADPF
jgi:hypothetical protein